MKKFSAAGTLVAASAAVALVGFGAPAFASASSAAHGMRPVLTGHVLTPTHAIEHVVLGSATPNKCDGDHDSDDVGCGSSPAAANKCDGDRDSDDVGCGSSPAAANKCDGDRDSDDVGCGSSPAAANKCDGDHDSDDVGCGSSPAAANKCDGDHDSDDVGCGSSSAAANKCDGDRDSDDVGCGSSPAAANKCDGDHDSDDVSCGASGHGIRPHAYRHHTNIWRPSMTWHASTTGYGTEHFHGLVRWVDGLKDSVLGLL